MWEPGYIRKCNPSIEYLELAALCIGIITWGQLLKNCRIIIFCDNQAVCSMVNNATSKCSNCMVLLWLLITDNLINNRRMSVWYVRSKDNILADALSHNHLDIFRKHSKNMYEKPEKPTERIWPLSKLWCH